MRDPKNRERRAGQKKNVSGPGAYGRNVSGDHAGMKRSRDGG